MPEPRVSVIVVSYNTRDKLRRCLSCIEPEHEVIVVDNASTDGSAEMVRAEFPHVRLVENAENRGFGAANNQGIDLASGERLLLLNSDAYPFPGAIRTLSLAMQDADEHDPESDVAAGGMLLNPDGSLQESVAGELTLGAVFLEQTFLERLARRFGGGYWETSRALERSERLSGQPVDVRQVMGACLMMRKGLERFDERFFLYCEDTDLCKRLRAHGRILYVPGARFTHELGSSSSATRWRAVARYNRGKELYFGIHHGPLAMVSCWFLNRLGALLRLIAWSAISVARPANAEQVRLFWRVLTAPVTGPDRSPKPRS